MKRLNGADAFMLGMETSKAYMHTFKVAIIDPSTDPNGWSFDKFYAEAASRMHVLPMLRWKYLASPLGLNHPYWVDDPDFDLHYHIRRVACPPPADHKTLCEFMAAVYSYQLDRNRPLWMIWVVEGLADGKVACVMLVHHAYVDGVGASWLMQQFYQPEVGVKAGSAPAYNPAPLPSWPTRLGWAVRDWPEVMIGNLPRWPLGCHANSCWTGSARQPACRRTRQPDRCGKHRSTSPSAPAAPLSVTASRWSALSASARRSMSPSTMYLPAVWRVRYDACFPT